MKVFRFSEKTEMHRQISCHVRAIASDPEQNESGPPAVFLSGGSTPEGFYQTIGKDSYYRRFMFFMGDERWAPGRPDIHNAEMIRKSLYSEGTLSPYMFFPIPQNSSPAGSAGKYINIISENTGNTPPFIFLLGIGTDGHTASLFPESVSDSIDIVIPVPAPDLVPQVPRISCNYNYINTSSHIIFLCGSRGKEKILEKIISGNPEYPAARVKGRKSTSLYIFNDT